MARNIGKIVAGLSGGTIACLMSYVGYGVLASIVAGVFIGVTLGTMTTAMIRAIQNKGI
jgi:hypothetical protein